MVAYMQDSLGRWNVMLPPYHYPHIREVDPLGPSAPVAAAEGHNPYTVREVDARIAEDPSVGNARRTSATRSVEEALRNQHESGPGVVQPNPHTVAAENGDDHFTVGSDSSDSMSISVTSPDGQGASTSNANAVKDITEDRQPTVEGNTSAVIDGNGNAEFVLPPVSVPKYRNKMIQFVMRDIEIRFPESVPGNTPRFHATRYAPGYQYIMDTWYITHTTWQDKIDLSKQADCYDWNVTLSQSLKKHLFDKLGGIHFNRVTQYMRTVPDDQGHDQEVEVLYAIQKDRPVCGSRDTWFLFKQKFPRNQFWRSKWQVLGYAYHRNELDDSKDAERIARGEPPVHQSIGELTGPEHDRWNHRDPYTFEGQNKDATWGGAAGPSVNIVEQMKVNRKRRKAREKAEKAAEKKEKKEKKEKEKRERKERKGRGVRNENYGEEGGNSVPMVDLPPVERSDENGGDDIAQSKVQTIGGGSAVIMPEMSDEREPYDESYHYKHEKILGIFSRDPERVQWDRDRVAIFESMHWNGRGQPKQEDDWLVIFHDGTSFDRSVLRRDFRTGMEIWTRDPRGLSPENFEKLAAALLNHECEIIKDHASRLVPLPRHLNMPKHPDMPVKTKEIKRSWAVESLRRMGRMVRSRPSIPTISALDEQD